MIRRIFPTDNLGAPLKLGAVEIPGTSPAVLVAIPRKAPGQVLDFGSRPIYSFAIDPEYTTPGTVIAVRPRGHPTPIMLRPGEVLTFADPCRELGYWHGSGALLDRLTAPPGGFLAFMVSDQRGEHVFFRRDVQPRPSVCRIRSGSAVPAVAAPTFGDVDQGAPIIPGGVALIRYTFIPRDANPALIDTPADLAGNVRIWALTPVVSLVAGDDGYGGSITSRADDSNALGVWVPVETFVLSYWDRSFSMTPPPGALALTATVDGLAGTGVVGLIHLVEVAG